MLKMESNRDSAELCYSKAVEALKGGDKDRALRMLQKSIRLYETDKARTLLAKVELMENVSFKIVLF